MATSQSRSYKIFQNEIEQPFELMKELSNGELMCKCYTYLLPEGVKNVLTLKEAEDYIKAHHVEPIQEEIL